MIETRKHKWYLQTSQLLTFIHEIENSSDWVQFSDKAYMHHKFQVKTTNPTQKCQMQILPRWKHVELIQDWSTRSKMSSNSSSSEKKWWERVDKKQQFCETKSSHIFMNIAGIAMGRRRTASTNGLKHDTNKKIHIHICCWQCH